MASFGGGIDTDSKERCIYRGQGGGRGGREAMSWQGKRCVNFSCCLNERELSSRVGKKKKKGPGRGKTLPSNRWGRKNWPLLLRGIKRESSAECLRGGEISSPRKNRGEKPAGVREKKEGVDLGNMGGGRTLRTWTGRGGADCSRCCWSEEGGGVDEKKRKEGMGGPLQRQRKKRKTSLLQLYQIRHAGKGGEKPCPYMKGRIALRDIGEGKFSTQKRRKENPKEREVKREMLAVLPHAA